MIHFILGLLISDGEQSTASQVCEITVLNDNKVINQIQDNFVFDAFFFLRLNAEITYKIRRVAGPKNGTEVNSNKQGESGKAFFGDCHRGSCTTKRTSKCLSKCLTSGGKVNANGL